jgi:hypothetical protein
MVSKFSLVREQAQPVICLVICLRSNQHSGASSDDGGETQRNTAGSGGGWSPSSPSSLREGEGAIVQGHRRAAGVSNLWIEPRGSSHSLEGRNLGSSSALGRAGDKPLESSGTRRRGQGSRERVELDIRGDHRGEVGDRDVLRGVRSESLIVVQSRSQQGHRRDFTRIEHHANDEQSALIRSVDKVGIERRGKTLDGLLGGRMEVHLEQVVGRSVVRDSRVTRSERDLGRSMSVVEHTSGRGRRITDREGLSGWLESRSPVKVQRTLPNVRGIRTCDNWATDQ